MLNIITLVGILQKVRFGHLCGCLNLPNSQRNAKMVATIKTAILHKYLGSSKINATKTLTLHSTKRIILLWIMVNSAISLLPCEICPKTHVAHVNFMNITRFLENNACLQCRAYENEYANTVIYPKLCLFNRL